MNEINRMREALKKKYPSPSFATKVNLMKPEQVRAIYLRLRDQGKL